MMEQNSAEIMELENKILVIIEEINQRAKAFSRGMWILAFLDVVFGILAYVLTSLALVAIFASASSLTAITIGGRVIQISKVRQLQKNLKPLNIVVGTWFVSRYKKLLKKKEKNKVKETKLSTIQWAALGGAVAGVIFAVVSIFVPQIAIAGDSIYNILVATGIEGISAFAGTFKGYKQKTEEEIAKAKEKIEKKEEAHIIAEVEKAKAEIASYEEKKKLVAEYEAEQQQKQNQ